MTDPRAIQLIMTLRRQGITDHRVLSAIVRTPRELFVDEPFAVSAYDNTALPISCHWWTPPIVQPALMYTPAP